MNEIQQRMSEIHPTTTLGAGLFIDPCVGFSTVSEIRQRLELKYCASLASGGTNGFPLKVDRIKDPRLRALAGAGMACKDWCIADLAGCTENLEGHAASVLMATLEDPTWGRDDFVLMGLIEKMESMRDRAMKGGLKL